MTVEEGMSRAIQIAKQLAVQIGWKRQGETSAYYALTVAILAAAIFSRMGGEE